MKHIPTWPRMMKLGTAAAYCDLSVAEFQREVQSGALPMPIKLGNSEHWSSIAIDEYLNRLTGDHRPDWRSRSGLYA